MEQADWSKFDYGDLVMAAPEAEPQAAPQVAPPAGPQAALQPVAVAAAEVQRSQVQLIVDGSFFANSTWEELTGSQPGVLSILEPGLDFDGLIGLDQF